MGVFITVRRRRGRKLVLTPDGTKMIIPRVSAHIGSAIIARAFRWREMLENGTHATIAEIPAIEKITSPTSGAFCG